MLREIEEAWDAAWEVEQVKNCEVPRHHLASDMALEEFEKTSLNDHKDGVPIYRHPAYAEEGPIIAAYMILRFHEMFNRQKMKKPCHSSKDPNHKPR